MVMAGETTPEDVMLKVILLQEPICGFSGAGEDMSCPTDNAELLWEEVDLGGRCSCCHWKHFACRSKASNSVTSCPHKPDF